MTISSSTSVKPRKRRDAVGAPHDCIRGNADESACAVADGWARVRECVIGIAVPKVLICDRFAIRVPSSSEIHPSLTNGFCASTGGRTPFRSPLQFPTACGLQPLWRERFATDVPQIVSADYRTVAPTAAHNRAQLLRADGIRMKDRSGRAVVYPSGATLTTSSAVVSPAATFIAPE